jgi:hypothetical protein
MWSLTNCSHQILLGPSNQGEGDGSGMWHAWEKRVHSVGEKAEGKRPLGRPRSRREDRVRMDIGVSAGAEGVVRIHLAQDRDLWRCLVNAAMNLRVLAPRS